jgi:hypothetical protein
MLVGRLSGCGWSFYGFGAVLGRPARGAGILRRALLGLW